MKAKILLLTILFSVTFFSCEKIKDLSAVSVDTDLKVDVPLEDDAVSIVLKSESIAGNAIKGNGILNLNDNADVKSYIEGIRGITVKKALGNISGLTAADEITNLIIKATLKSTEYKLYDGTGITLSMANASTMVILLDNVKSLIAALDKEGYDNDITFNVSGTSKVPVGSRLKLKITLPSSVKYTPL